MLNINSLTDSVFFTNRSIRNYIIEFTSTLVVAAFLFGPEDSGTWNSFSHHLQCLYPSILRVTNDKAQLALRVHTWECSCTLLPWACCRRRAVASSYTTRNSEIGEAQAHRTGFPLFSAPLKTCTSSLLALLR